MSEHGTITIKKQDLWKYSTFVFLALFILMSFLYFSKSPSSGNVINNPNPSPSPSPNPIPSKITVELGDAPILGSKDAKVTIVEFSDYECPFCGRHFSQTLPQIKSNYVDSGKARLAFKDFPLSFHPNAQKAAEAARCAGEQGKYWEMHDILFENQQALSLSSYKSWAKGIGLDSTRFDSCIDSGKYAQAVSNDLNYGQQVGVQGTPAFFINGILISGACPYSTFSQAIDAELAGKTWAVSNCQISVR